MHRAEPPPRRSRSSAPGQLLLLENLRFHAGEEKNDPDFAAALAALADVYVNDAFGTAHRAHASTVGMVRSSSRAVAAGDLLRAELEHLRVVREPERPLARACSAAPRSPTSSRVLEALATACRRRSRSAAPWRYTFLPRAGEPVGKSLVEADQLEDARRVMRRRARAGRRLLLPTDHVVAQNASRPAPPPRA